MLLSVIAERGRTVCTLEQRNAARARKMRFVGLQSSTAVWLMKRTSIGYTTKLCGCNAKNTAKEHLSECKINVDARCFDCAQHDISCRIVTVEIILNLFIAIDNLFKAA